MKRSKHRNSRLSQLFNLQNAIALSILCLCGLVGGWLTTQAQIDWTHPDHIVQMIKQQGAWGVLLYIGFLILAIVIGPIPSTPVTVAAGAIWGPVTAGIYAAIGVFLGSLTAYFIGRTLGKSTVQALLGKVIYLSKHRGELYLGWLVFVMHLIPVMPYDMMSYGAGISGLSLPIYASAAFLGIVPCAFFLTFMGSSFTIGLPFALTFIGLFLLMLMLLPWGVKRHNWLGLRDIIRIEQQRNS